MASLSRWITLRLHHQHFKVNELVNARLSPRIRIVASSRADKTDIGNARLLRSVNKLRAYVKLVLVRRRDQANGIASGFLERLGHLPDATWLVRDDFDTQAFQLLDLFMIGMQCEAHYCVDFSRKVSTFEDQFGDEEACLAINSGDADFTRHSFQVVN